MDAKKEFKKHYVLIGWAIVWVIFLILALVLPATTYKGPTNDLGYNTPDDDGLKGAKFAYWGGFIFINIAFIVVGAVMFFAQRTGKVHANSRISIYVPLIGYFAVAFILNLIFMIVYSKNWTPGVLIPNIILLLLAALLIMFVLRGEGHVAEVGEKLIEKAVVLENYELQVNNLYNISEDPEVKQALEVLRDDVKFSDSMSVPAAQQQEAMFMDKVMEIQELLEDEAANKEELLKVIKRARNTWKLRNDYILTLNSRKG